MPVRTLLLVVVPSTANAAIAATVVVGRVDPGDPVPLFVALAGVAVTLALDVVALVTLRRRRPRAEPAAALVVVPVLSPAIGPQDEYVDSLLADLAG